MRRDLPRGRGDAPEIKEAGRGDAPEIKRLGRGDAPEIKRLGRGEAPEIKRLGRGDAPEIKETGRGEAPEIKEAGRSDAPDKGSLGAARREGGEGRKDDLIALLSRPFKGEARARRRLQPSIREDGRAGGGLSPLARERPRVRPPPSSR